MPLIRLLACSCLLATLLLGQLASAATPTIGRIRFVGLKRQHVRQSHLHYLLRNFVGRPATPENLRAAILTVDKLGRFGHGNAEIEHMMPGKVVLELRFSPTPRRIDQLLFTRDGWSPDERLAKRIERELRARAIQLDSRQGATYHPYLVRMDEERLTELFQAQGYLDVRVRHRAIRRQRLVRLIFRVDVGQKVVLRAVKFSGSSRPDEELRAVMETRAGGGVLGSAHLVRSTLERDVERLAVLLRTHGYRDVVVEARERRVSRNEVEVHVHFEEGPRYRVRSVRLRGTEVSDELRSKLQTTPGKPWSEQLLQGDIERISAWFRERGYPDAEVVPKTNIVQPARSDGRTSSRGRGEPPELDDSAAGGVGADVVFTIERHRRVHVERIWFSGNTITSKETLRKMLAVEEGDLFRPSTLQASKQNMLRSELFRDVDVEVLPGSDKSQRFIVFRVKESFRIKLDAAGPALTLVNLDILDLPSSRAELEHGTLFSGGGQMLRLRLATDDLQVSLEDPYIFTNLAGSVSVHRRVTRPAGAELESWGFTPAFGLSLFQGTMVGQLFWKGELSSLDPPDGSQVPDVLTGADEGLFLSSAGVTARLDLTKRDDADRFTYTGAKLNLRLEHAGGWLGSDLDFLGGGLGVEGFLPLHANGKGQHTVLTLRSRFDWIRPLDGQVLPYHRRVVPALRGYSGSTLGTEQRLVTGGATFWVGGEGALATELGLRLPVPIGRRNAVMPFVSAGGLFDQEPPDLPSSLYYSAGLELVFSLFDERLEGAFWFAYPLGGPADHWETDYVGASVGGAL